MPTPKTEQSTIHVGRRAYTIYFRKERIKHPRLNRMRNGTIAVISETDTGRLIGCGHTMRNPKDTNNPAYAKNTAFRRAMAQGYEFGKIHGNTRIALFKAYFSKAEEVA